MFVLGHSNSIRKSISPSSFECIICMGSFDEKVSLCHSTGKCDHQVCQLCTRNYFKGTLKDTRYANYQRIQCPNPYCKEHFTVTEEFLNKIFSASEIADWWKASIIKTYITNKVYCPFKDCKAVFDADLANIKKCTFTECYECRRGFCMACRTRWHPGKTKVFDDKAAWEKTLKQAEKNLWCRCPKCAHIVEKVYGCLNVRCRCGEIFCYRCGLSLKTCRAQCDSFDQEKLNAIRSKMFTQKAI